MSAPNCNVVVSSRVRLARNYADVPFETRMDADMAGEVIRRAADAVAKHNPSGNFKRVNMRDLPPIERQYMVEQHLISRDLIKNADVAAVLISENRDVSIMVNEEDHLRIQILLPGMQLESASENAFAADEWLGEQGAYAFDAQWGYLTSCPTNTGTGLRASFMMHLPAITTAGQMGSVIQAVSKIGMTVRGLYGEGSEAQGNLYQLSNQVTLGRTEEEIVRGLTAVAEQVVNREEALRAAFYDKDAIGLRDKLMRACGTLGNAYVLPVEEYMNLWSDARMAAAMGMLVIACEQLDEWMMNAQPASICHGGSKDLSKRERDMLRAERSREILARL